MREMVIFGTGGLGRETHEALEAMVETGAPVRFLGFLDGNAKKHGSLVHGAPVLGGQEWLAQRREVEVVVAIGNPAVRRRIVGALEATGHRAFGSIVHPRATLGRRVEVGAGAIVLQQASITTDVRLGRHVVVNPAATIAHDDILDDFVLVAPGANVSGTVHVGEGADIGTNAAVLQNLTVGAWSVVGGGALVRSDVPPNAVVVGVPARVAKMREHGWQTHL